MKTNPRKWRNQQSFFTVCTAGIWRQLVWTRSGAFSKIQIRVGGGGEYRRERLTHNSAGGAGYVLFGQPWVSFSVILESANLRIRIKRAATILPHILICHTCFVCAFDDLPFLNRYFFVVIRLPFSMALLFCDGGGYIFHGNSLKYGRKYRLIAV